MGLDIFGGIGIGLDLLAQGGHEHPQGGNVAVPVPAVDILGDEGMSQHFAGVPCQQAENLVFHGRQLQLLAAKAGAAGGVVDPKLPVGIDGSVRTGLAAHKRQPP